ncbi:retrovirus-related pol polyprotein from transposon TNT 1-94 [Tanacetum coccineum]
MARQCPKLKRKRDTTWFRDKVLLVEAQGSSKVLNEEELEFLAHHGVAEGPVTHTVITHNAAYQADDLDAYDYDCDDFSTAKAVLMDSYSSYGSDVLFEVNKDNLIANESLSVELERYKERVKLLEERQNVDLSINTFVNVNYSAAMNDSVNYVEMCNKCLELEAELIKQHNVVEKDEYNKLSKRFSELKQHCISLELAISMFDDRHELCFLEFVSDINASSKSKPTGRTFTLVGNACPLTRTTATNKVPLREPIPLEVVAQESVVTKVVQIVLWYLDSGCSKHMIGDRSQLTNFVYKFLGTVKFSNDQIAKIIRYGDYQIGNITISRVYYVEGLGHNLFFVGQFCDSDLEVAFRKHTCFVRNLEGVDLLSGSQETNLYTLLIRDMMVSFTICLLSKALKTKSCINGKKYILVIVDDYSRFTWMKFLASKDEAPDFIIKFLKMIQVRLNAPVRNIRTNNRNELVNQTLRSYYESVDDWDRLFQPMFDEYFNPPTIVVSPVPVAAAPRNCFEESPKMPHFHDDPLHESLHEDSTSQGSSSNVRPIHTPFESLGRWTKDHPIANVIGDPSCFISTRKQLQTDAMWCYFDAFLTSVEPKNFKQAMTEPSDQASRRNS